MTQRRTSKPKSKAPWFEIRNAKDDEPAQIFIYEEIDDFWGISAKDFVQSLSKLEASEIDLHINSPGGSVFDGHAIYNALRAHSATITTYVDGLAASIASVVALAGDKVIIAKNAAMMIHEPFGFCMGGPKDMRNMAGLLDKMRDAIAIAYVDKTGKPTEEVNSAMEDETWLVGQEAVDFGLADELAPELEMAARFDLNALGFRKPPQDFVADEPEPDEPAIEAIEVIDRHIAEEVARQLDRAPKPEAKTPAVTEDEQDADLELKVRIAALRG